MYKEHRDEYPNFQPTYYLSEKHFIYIIIAFVSIQNIIYYTFQYKFVYKVIWYRQLLNVSFYSHPTGDRNIYGIKL